MEMNDFAGKNIVLKFTATWCGPCKAVTPVLEEVSKETGIPVQAVDVDQDPDFAAQLGVRSVPFMVALKDGNIVHTMTGAKAKPQIQTLFNAILATSA